MSSGGYAIVLVPPRDARAVEQAERRRERVRLLAERWQLRRAPRATHSGTLSLAGHAIPCVVLDDGRRVLSHDALIRAIGRTGKQIQAAKDGGGRFFRVPPFLVAENLGPFVERHLAGSSAGPILYSPANGGVGHGYEAHFLPRACGVYLDARREGKLRPTQRRIAGACEVLVAALADVGVDTLIDEATGFQPSWPAGELQKLLGRYVSRGLARWERTSEPDFYRPGDRLRGRNPWREA
jgi:hypothetical protein